MNVDSRTGTVHVQNPAEGKASAGRSFTFDMYVLHQYSTMICIAQTNVKSMPCRVLSGYNALHMCLSTLAVYPCRASLTLGCKIKNCLFSVALPCEWMCVVTGRLLRNRVFGWDAKQVDIYNRTARDIVNSCLEGYNGTIFAYGQTGVLPIIRGN